MFALVESTEVSDGIPDIPELPKLRELLAVVARGETLTAACKAGGTSVFKFWKLRSQMPDVESAYEAALMLGREAVAQECIRIARATTYETVSADRLLIDTLKWNAARVLGGFSSGKAGVNVHIDQRSIHVGEAVAQVAGRRRSALREGAEVEHRESGERD